MPTRPNIENASVPLQRESEIFLGGYPLPLVTEFTSDVTAQDDTYDVFGLEEQLFFRTIESATLNLACGFSRESQPFMDLLSDHKPDNTVYNVYVPNAKVQLDAVRMYRTADDDGYNAVEFYGRWNPVFRTPAGAPRERGTLRADGRCEVPVRVVAESGKWIAAMFDVVTLGAATGTPEYKPGTAVLTLAANIKVLPTVKGYRNSGKYAFSVEVQKRDTGVVTKYARVPVTDAMVDSSGNVKIYATDLLGTGLTLADITHVFVTYLCEFATTSGLMGQPGTTLATFKGKYD